MTRSCGTGSNGHVSEIPRPIRKFIPRWCETCVGEGNAQRGFVRRVRRSRKGKFPKPDEGPLRHSHRGSVSIQCREHDRMEARGYVCVHRIFLSGCLPVPEVPMVRHNLARDDGRQKTDGERGRRYAFVGCDQYLCHLALPTCPTSRRPALSDSSSPSNSCPRTTS